MFEAPFRAERHCYCIVTDPENIQTRLVTNPRRRKIETRLISSCEVTAMICKSPENSLTLQPTRIDRLLPILRWNLHIEGRLNAEEVR